MIYLNLVFFRLIGVDQIASRLFMRRRYGPSRHTLSNLTERYHFADMVRVRMGGEDK